MSREDERHRRVIETGKRFDIPSIPSTQPADVSKSQPEIDTTEEPNWRAVAAGFADQLKELEAQLAQVTAERDQEFATRQELQSQLATLTATNSRIANNARIAAEVHAKQRDEYRLIVQRAEQAEATVAALASMVEYHVHGWAIDGGPDGGLTEDWLALKPNIPAAAERFLAAARVAEAFHQAMVDDTSGDLLANTTTAMDDALDAWRKAGQ